MESGPFGRVVVFENFNGDSPHSVISRTASAARMETSFTFTREGGEVSCRMMLGGLFLASATAHSEKLAREAACRTAIERLKETSFTVQIKVPFVGGTSCIDRTFASSETGTDYRADLDVPIEEHNIGRKIMKLMGWTGGGLGKNQQGLEEPVRPNDVSVKRSGLGIKNARDFKQKVSNLLRDYCRGESKNDLVFSPEFTRDERKIIHELVQKYNLKSRSYGKGEDKRHIVVFKKINAQEIVEDLIKCGGETEKYILIPPSSA
ncbi:hypothetical protein AAG570_010938 [Ranatra chinensis]|uniref:NF-kappa-B-repressing factor n=1 Tax=Ranatra chinensis TaxID=642074 RepID=A0ABD0YJE3_9HEMI